MSLLRCLCDVMNKNRTRSEGDVRVIGAWRVRGDRCLESERYRRPIAVKETGRHLGVGDGGGGVCRGGGRVPGGGMGHVDGMYQRSAPCVRTDAVQTPQTAW